MFRDKKDLQENLKDPQKDLKYSNSSMPAPYQAAGFGSGSYRKTNKLITALYMVTDIMDKEEPLRNKLRTLGTEIISDINSLPYKACGKISETMSFLGIARTLNIISAMNCDILEKEFQELDSSIKDFVGNPEILNRRVNLEEFLKGSPLEGWPKAGVDKFIPPPPKGYSSRGELNSQGHTHLGVQKASTLLRSIKDISHAPEIYKRQRQGDILSIIKMAGGSATIKDVKDKTTDLPKGHSLNSCSEKTIQRELISMIKDGVLKKTGEKRWSRYFLVGN